MQMEQVNWLLKYSMAREKPCWNRPHVLVARRLNMSQLRALPVLGANSIQGHIKSPVASRSKEAIIPLYLALVILHLEGYVQSWVQ